MNRVILNSADFCAVTEDGTLVEYIPKDPDMQQECILAGKVDRMMPGLECAFVDIGRKKDGFLPLKENSRTFTGGEIRSGDLIAVQIKKEETGDKGAFLTRDITIAGRYVILMPLNRYTGVSSRIENEDNRRRLREFGKNLCGERFGLVMRYASLEADEQEIREEAEELYRCWEDILKKLRAAGSPCIVFSRKDTLQSLKDDYAACGVDEIREIEELSSDLRRQLASAFERKTRLPAGGNIVTDRCEAMTVIDVNTASARNGSGKEQTVLETNLEACEAIAHLARLRNLSGIILVDFVDMDDETDRSLVLRKCEECFGNDRIKTVIHGWTSLGLLEMTRKRTGPELRKDACGGAAGTD